MELLGIYDNKGNIIGKTIVRGDKSAILNENEQIAVAMIFIRNKQGHFLIQKTSAEKGGKYSSSGGHVDSGETPVETIKREVSEELGIDISNDDIKELGYLLYDKPIRYMFYLEKDIDFKDVIVQKEEVDFFKYMNKFEIKKLIYHNNITKSHGIIFNKILSYLWENRYDN